MDALLARLKKTFLLELDERVQALNRDLLALEGNPGEPELRGLLNSLFRSAHSLKGAAGSVEIRVIEAACHHLEDLFAAAVDQRIAIDPETLDLLLGLVDAVQDAGSRLRQDLDIDQGMLAKRLPDIAAAAARARVAEKIAVAPVGEPAPRPAQRVESLSPPPVEPVAAESAPVELPPAKPLSTVLPIMASPPIVMRRETDAPALPEASADRAPLVRIATEKLDKLLARSGELIVASRRTALREADLADLHQRLRRWRNGQKRKMQQSAAPAASNGEGDAADFLRHLDRDLERIGAMLAADRAALGQVVGSIDGEIRRARMQPLSEVCLGLGRIVRDVARAGGKNAQLLVVGGEVELDRSVLDGLKDPLLHLVRNAVDHGVESPEKRRASGKPAQSTIRLTASLYGNAVEITVQDDGGGLDIAAIREQARRRGLPDGDDEQIVHSIFLPGFSTSASVTNLSGRGVGLDEVRAKVERMRGFVGVTSIAGQGTRFTIRVPLTLTTLRALLVRHGDQVFAIDSTAIVDLRRIRRDGLRSVGGCDMLPVDGRLVPVASLARVLGTGAETDRSPDEKLPIVIVGVAGAEAAFVVDELLDEQELMVRSLGSRLRYVRHIAGATILADGRIALILNGAELVATARDVRGGRSLMIEATESVGPLRHRLLLAEDSLTTRTLECSILEAAGYEVIAVSDGMDAWIALQQGGVHLVVSDIDMPRMDGLTLTETIRGSPQFRELPIVLITARETDAEKARGLSAGADAYLMKSGFDQTLLLETIGQFL